MASLFKKTVPQTAPNSGGKASRASKKWWGRYRDASGVERRRPLSSDKMAAQSMLNEILLRVEREKAGLLDPTEEQRKRPLREHIVDFKRYLQNKAVTAKQVHTATTQLQRMIDHSGWKLVGDINAGDALEFLGGLRDSGRSAQTYNHYLKSAKQFTRWLVRDGRTAKDPLVHVGKLNVGVDRRHGRRALSSDEFRRLVEAAMQGVVVESISGPDRAMLYVLAAWTGFRKGEIGSLTVRSFRLDDDPPTATVAACHSKRKRQDTQILHPDVAQLLRAWLATKSMGDRNDPLFPVSGRVPGGTERKTHKMMQLDLAEARRLWVDEAETEEERSRRLESDFLTYQNHDGLFADFHSNRHLFITSLEQAGISPKMAQTLARHSDVRLTLGVYTHVGTDDQLRAVNSLPSPPGASAAKGPTTTGSASVSGQRGVMGIDGGANGADIAPKMVPGLVPCGAQIGASESASVPPRIASNCTEAGVDQDDGGDFRIVASPLQDDTCCAELHQAASLCSKSNQGQEQVSPRGLEPLTFGSGGLKATDVAEKTRSS